MGRSPAQTKRSQYQRETPFAQKNDHPPYRQCFAILPSRFGECQRGGCEAASSIRPCIHFTKSNAPKVHFSLNSDVASPLKRGEHGAAAVHLERPRTSQ
jgi:hypothetical protein